MHETAIVILAAGEATRMGSPKQLLSYEGSTLVRHAAQQALASKAREVNVVVGAHAERVREELGGLPVRIIYNPDYSLGMGTSIRAGVGEVAQRAVECVLLTLADQPQLGPETYNRLMDRYAEGESEIVTSAYAGTVGVPVLFGRSHYGALLSLAPTEGCKGLILQNLSKALQLDCPEALADIDTPADYANLVSKP